MPDFIDSRTRYALREAEDMARAALYSERRKIESIRLAVRKVRDALDELDDLLKKS